MRLSFPAHLLAFSVFCLAGFNSIFAQAFPELALVTDTSIISMPCHYPVPTEYRSCPDGSTVMVHSKLIGHSGEGLTYEYSVSAGKVIGAGPDVLWDMTSVKEGTYTIHAAVWKDGSEIAKSSSKIRVEQCADCGAECLACPNLSIVSSSEAVHPNDVIELKISESRGQRFLWTLVGGEIVEGQGTSRIKVKVDGDEEGTISITVRVQNGGFCFEDFGCPDSAKYQLTVVPLRPEH